LLQNFLSLKKIAIEDFVKGDILEFKGMLASSTRTTSTHITVSERLSPASINRCLSAVRAYLTFLIDNDCPLKILPSQFKMVKKDKKQIQVAELTEFIRLIEAPSELEANQQIGLRNRALLEILFSTGMRISELVSLNLKDLNPEGRILITGKGRKQRFVYLTPRSLEALNSYLKVRTENLPALFIPTKGKTSTDPRRRLTTRYIQNKIQFYLEKLHINIPITPHSLRHGFATYLAEQGASPVAIQMLLGHESLNTTTRYVNASEKFAQESHQKYHPLLKSTK
jgi:site-specific recombinase XerD